MHRGIAIVKLPWEPGGLDGARRHAAPDEILNELAFLDTYDFRLGWDPIAATPRTIVQPFDATLTDLQIARAITAQAVVELDAAGITPFCVGGGPLVMAGAAAGLGNPVGLVEFSPTGRCCLRYSALEDTMPTVQIGVRSASAVPSRLASAQSFHVLDMATLRGPNGPDRLDAALKSLPRRVFVHVDLRVFDPTAAPAVPFPLPGGMDYDEVLAAVDAVCAATSVVGWGISNLACTPSDAPTVRLATRLLAYGIGRTVTAAPAA